MKDDDKSLSEEVAALTIQLKRMLDKAEEGAKVAEEAIKSALDDKWVDYYSYAEEEKK